MEERVGEELRETINVGLLRVCVGKLAHRMTERMSAYEAAEVLGLDLREPGTDLAKAMRDLLDVARLRVTRDEHTGDLTFHDLLALRAPVDGV